MFAPKVTKPQTKAGASPTNKLAPQRSMLVARPFGGGGVEQADRENATAQVTTRGVAWDFSKISVFPADRPNRPQESSPVSRSLLPAIIQRKLVVGPANDPLEHEADRIADRVMRIPSPEGSPSR